MQRNAALHVVFTQCHISRVAHPCVHHRASVFNFMSEEIIPSVCRSASVHLCICASMHLVHLCISASCTLSPPTRVHRPRARSVLIAQPPPPRLSLSLLWAMEAPRLPSARPLLHARIAAELRHAATRNATKRTADGAGGVVCSGCVPLSPSPSALGERREDVEPPAELLLLCRLDLPTNQGET